MRSSSFVRGCAAIFAAVFFLLVFSSCDRTESTYAPPPSHGQNGLDPEVARLIKPEEGEMSFTTEMARKTSDNALHKDKAPEADVPTSQERKLISTSDLRILVTDVEQTGAEIRSIVARAGGYVGKEEFTRTTYSQQIIATLRVPAGTFDKTVQDIVALAKTVEEKNVQVEDVTEEFIDVTTRIATKKDVEARYRALLQQARNVSEILEIEEKIGEVRAEIESAEGRLKYLTNRVGYSTIKAVWYTRTESYREEDSFGARIVQGLHNGWKGIQYAVIGVVTAWPVFLLLLLLVFGIVRFARGSRRKAHAGKSQQANTQI